MFILIYKKNNFLFNILNMKYEIKWTNENI
jgi:hypothetical protein